MAEMTKEEILKKALEIANTNGMRHSEMSTHPSKFLVAIHHPYEIIFNHYFAEALWGSLMITAHSKLQPDSYDVHWQIPTWQYHLQQMVIADDPVQYLGEHLPDSELTQQGNTQKDPS